MLAGPRVQSIACTCIMASCSQTRFLCDGHAHAIAARAMAAVTVDASNPIGMSGASIVPHGVPEHALAPKQRLIGAALLRDLICTLSPMYACMLPTLPKDSLIVRMHPENEQLWNPEQEDVELNYETLFVLLSRIPDRVPRKDFMSTLYVEIDKSLGGAHTYSSFMTGLCVH